MAASVTTLPNNRNLSKDAIWLGITTDLWSDSPASFELVVTSGNTIGQQVTFTWGGSTVTFTVATSPDTSGLEIPRYSTGTVADYVVSLAEYLRQNETLTDDFIITSTATSVLITARSTGALDLTATENISGMAITTTDSVGNFSETNLRALLKVVTRPTDPDDEETLATFHAPYDASTGTASIDVHSAFCRLKPHLPTTASIAAFASGDASDAYVAWSYRLADKYGTPAVAEALVLNNEYTFRTFYGSTAGDALEDWRNEVRRHMVRRRDGETFYKPIGEAQPDWGYFYNASTGTRKIRVDTTAQDGTFTAAAIEHTIGSVQGGTILWASIGPPQLGLDVWADPDNPIVRYSVGYYNSSSGASLGKLYFEVMPDCQPWGMYLLFDNGVTGCETIWLKGKKTEGYDASAELVQRPRPVTWTPDIGEFDKLNAQGQTTWDCSTGHFNDDAYLVALRQLPLSTAAWLVDVENERFLRVNVDAKRIETVTQDDQDLFFMNITLRAAWTDQASNL